MTKIKQKLIPEPEMITIPGGAFVMGSDENKGEQPIYEVTVSGFQMGKYPVTQAQYEAVMGNNPAHFSENSQNPVECVTWYDAVEFCARLSELTGREYRLPTEAEWEYACRAGTQTRFCFGDDKSQLGDYAWFSGNSNGTTHPVGEKRPNPWGIHDMHGNVWEWCEDDWHDSYEGATTDGSAWIEGEDENNHRLLRGGSWLSNPENCRSADRNMINPDYANCNVGLRVVASSKT